MMVIIGKKYVSFVGKDGNSVTGVTLYVGEPLTDGDGIKGDKFFCHSDAPNYPKFTSLRCGDEIEVTYNKYGKVSGCEVIRLAEEK